MGSEQLKINIKWILVKEMDLSLINLISIVLYQEMKVILLVDPNCICSGKVKVKVLSLSKEKLKLLNTSKDSMILNLTILTFKIITILWSRITGKNKME